MHRLLLSLVTTFIFAAFAPASFASDFIAKPGHYESSEHGTEHVSFLLTRGGIITNFRIDGYSVETPHYMTPDASHAFRFGKSHASFEGRSHGRYSGHGVWAHADVCKGDFRHYESSAEANSYHVWKAHWVSH